MAKKICKKCGTQEGLYWIPPLQRFGCNCDIVSPEFDKWYKVNETLGTLDAALEEVYAGLIGDKHGPKTKGSNPGDDNTGESGSGDPEDSSVAGS